MKDKIYIHIDLNVIVSDHNIYWSLDNNHVKREIEFSVPEAYAPYVRLDEIYTDLMQKALLEYLEKPQEADDEHLEKETP